MDKDFLKGRNTLFARLVPIFCLNACLDFLTATHERTVEVVRRVVAKHCLTINTVALGLLLCL